MKKITYIFFILIVFTIVKNANSQNYDIIKKQDVVFINYKSLEKIEIKKELGSYEVNPDKKPYLYQFFHYDTNKELYKTPFMTLHFRNFENTSKEKELITFRVHKSFLKKNRDVIINSRVMQKIGVNKTLDILKNANKIFLIDDEHEIKNKTILIKQVRLILPSIE